MQCASEGAGGAVEGDHEGEDRALDSENTKLTSEDFPRRSKSVGAGKSPPLPTSGT